MPVRGFWEWLFTKDRDGDRGISNLLNRWLLLHLSLGGFAAAWLQTDVSGLAKDFAIPAAATLIGITFGWAGRSAGLLHQEGFAKFIIEKGAPIEGYLYSLQLAIALVLVFLSFVLITASGGTGLMIYSNEVSQRVNQFVIISMGSLALHECWGAITFVNKLTVLYYRTLE